MKKFIILMAFLLTACAGEAYPAGTPTPTPNPGEIALQMMQEKVAAEGTQMAVGLQFTATAQVIGMTVTSQAISTQEAITQQARRDAVATSDQARMDAAATQQRVDAVSTAEQARADAQAATVQAVLALQSTQNADATATFTVMTMTAIPPHATLTQIANEQIIALNDNEVRESDNRLNQQPLEWLVILIVFLLTVGVGWVMGLRYSRTREIKDEDGSVRVLVLDNKTVLAPKLLASPVLDLETMSMPEMTNAAEQAEVTKRAQMVEMVAALPVGPSNAANDGIFSMFTSAKRFEISEPPADLLPAETVSAIDADWKEGNDG